MATAAHCLTCFEALDAHLESRKPLSLGDIESSYALYTSSLSSPASKAPQPPALRRLAADATDSSPSPSSSSSTTASTPATSISSLSLGTATSSAPLFVTWNTFSSGTRSGVDLRGCIGTFEPQPLSTGLPEYATLSALHDTRFPPLTKEDLPRLQVAVTLLTDFEDVDDRHDWEIGTHGLRLSFSDDGRRYGATYLPDVAAEQGWTKDQTLYSLVRKAGWVSGRSGWKALDLKVTRYKGRKATLDYQEFKRWREWLATAQ
ncbi:hypothetical protein EsDP_00005537 [Epichloe bromicola]|uniref:AMMECR1 domain-containing protein n=1 Tax=Epichloe bromicola TaxID=79588 RepID=A0ABQ0CUY2_9HYPO